VESVSASHNGPLAGRLRTRPRRRLWRDLVLYAVTLASVTFALHIWWPRATVFAPLLAILVVMVARGLDALRKPRDGSAQRQPEDPPRT